MFRWRRGKSVPTEAAPAEPASAAATPAPASGPAPSAPPPTIATPAVSVATGELAAIARRLHVGPPRPAHVPAHKAEVPVPVAPPAAPGPVEDGPVEDAPVGAAERTAPAEPVAAHDARPDLRPLALIVQEALAHHFGPDGAWALVRRGPESTAGFFDELMTAHIARDVALALGASPATAELPLVDARSMRAAPAPALDGDAPLEDAPLEDAPLEDAPLEDAPLEDAPLEDAPVEDAETAADVVGRELAVFDRDPLDDDLAELVSPVRREHAGLRALRSA